MKKMFFILFLLFFSGCTNKNINPNEYIKINTEISKFKPNKKEIRNPSVLILKVTTENSNAKRYGLDNLLKGELESLLINSRSVKLVTRRKPTTLKDEIKLAQQAKIVEANLNEANYIIIANIDTTTYDVEYSKGMDIGAIAELIDKRLKVLKKPSNYSYKACVIGKVQILKIPENYPVAIIPFNTCVTKTTYERENLKQSLLTLATKDVVEDIRVKLLNIFTQKGYIYEIRKKGDEIIIETTLGKNNGAKEGMEVNIYTVKEEKNPLTGKNERSVIKIGDGVISDKITSNSSWVIVKDLKENIKIGDYIRPMYQEDLLDKVKRLVR